MQRLQVLFTHAIFISCCAVALAIETSRVLHIQTGFEVYLLIFLSTCCSYNLYRLISLFPFQQLSGGLRFLRQQVTSVILFLFCAGGMIGCMLQEPALWVYVILATVLTIGYCLPLLPLSFAAVFQRAGYLKTILLAGTWAFVTVFWPVASDGSHDGKIVWILFLQRFSFMFILCIIFDARDLKTDLLRSLGSLVTSVSRTSLQVITILSFVCYMSLSILLSLHLRHPSLAVAWGFTGLATWFLYRFSHRQQGYWFYYFGVDGLMLLSALATFLATN